MSILIKNVDLISLDEKGMISRDADILIDETEIAQIGNISHDDFLGQIIDGKGLIAIPAFFNAHCHAPMTFERGWAEDLPLDRWFNERIWVAESALTPEDVYWGAAMAA